MLPAPFLTDASFYTVVAGITIALAARMFRRLMAWGIELVFLAGLLLILAQHILVFILGVGDPLVVYLFKAGVAVMLASTLAWWMAERESKITNWSFRFSLSPVLMSLLVAFLLETVLVVSGPGFPDSIYIFYIGLTTLGVTVWLAWHFFAVKVFKLYLKWSGKGRLYSTGKPDISKPKSMFSLMSEAFMLVLMVFSIIVLGVQVFAPQIDLSRFQDLVLVAKLSLVAEAAVGVFGPPAYMLFEALDLRRLDALELIVEKVHPVDYLDSMIDVFALIGFLLTMRDVTLSYTASAQAEPSIVLYTLITLLFYYLAITLPPALLATTMYHRYSYAGQAAYLYEKLRPREVQEIKIG